MSNWSSSSSYHCTLTEKQTEILDVLRDNPGNHTVSQIAARLGIRVEGTDMEGIQVKVLEQRLGRIKRRKEGRFIYWKFIKPTTT